MKELELCHPSDKAQNYSWRLFNKKNHRCNNRYATHDELWKALDEWVPDGSPTCCEETSFYNINPTSKLWLKRCVLDEESIDGLSIFCLYGEGYTFDCRWYKVILYDNLHKRYILRTFASITNKHHYCNHLPLAQDKSFKVDLSTMGTHEKFWIHVKELFILNNSKIET